MYKGFEVTPGSKNINIQADHTKWIICLIESFTNQIIIKRKNQKKLINLG